MLQSDTNTKLIVLMAITCYLLILVPDVIVSNVGESGIILETVHVESQSLPQDIQDLLLHKNGYYIIILEDLSSEERFAVISEHMNYRNGSFVRVGDSTNEWYSDSRILSSRVSLSFDKIIIGEIERVNTGSWIIEAIARLGLLIRVILLKLSSLGFLAGGFVFILFLSILLKGTVAIWNIPGILSCYSFQFFCVNVVNFLNGVDIETTYMIFGSLFPVLIPLTIKLKRYEETEDGEQKICSLYHANIKMLLKIINIFG